MVKVRCVMFTVNAEIKLSKDQMSRKGFSGMRPSFDTGKELIMCTVYSKQGKFIPVGTRQKVDIELPYGEQYADIIKPGYTFSLHVGGKIIGRGLVKNILKMQ